MKKQKLDPCKYCGGKMKFYKNDYNHFIGVQCQGKDCGATVIFFPGHVNLAYNDKERIVNFHNQVEQELWKDA